VTSLRHHWKHAKHASDRLLSILRSHASDLTLDDDNEHHMLATDDFVADEETASATASSLADVKEMMTRIVELKEQWIAFDL
jgi:hypothetical protein